MISTAAMGVIFLQLYNPSYGIINPIIRLFNKNFTDNILLLKGPAFISYDMCLYLFTGTTTLMILGNIMAVPRSKGGSNVRWSKRIKTGLVYYDSND